MKVKQLIEELQKHSPEAPVFLYIDEAEEFGTTTGVSTITDEENLPYGKGDQPDFDGELVLVTGWIV